MAFNVYMFYFCCNTYQSKSTVVVVNSNSHTECPKSVEVVIFIHACCRQRYTSTDEIGSWCIRADNG